MNNPLGRILISGATIGFFLSVITVLDNRLMFDSAWSRWTLFIILTSASTSGIRQIPPHTIVFTSLGLIFWFVIIPVFALYSTVLGHITFLILVVASRGPAMWLFDVRTKTGFNIIRLVQAMTILTGAIPICLEIPQESILSYAGTFLTVITIAIIVYSTVFITISLLNKKDSS